MKRAAIYVRCSTTAQDTDLQRREIEQYVNARGWSFSLYEDQGYSGTNDRRPMLQALLRDARLRKFDVIVCWKLDRFFRSLKHLVLTLQDLTDVGIEFISLRDNVDLTTASGRLMIQIIGAFSEFEAAIIKERVRAGLAAAKAKGKKLGRPKKTDEKAIRQLRAQGYSYRKIAGTIGVSLATVQRSLRIRPFY